MEQPYQFSTKRYLAAIGVVKYEYRDYLPVLGKWAERDPLEEASDVNLYRAMGNSTVNVVDLLGMFNAENIFKGLGLAAGGVATIAGAAAIEVETIGIGSALAVTLAVSGGAAVGAGIAEIATSFMVDEHVNMPETGLTYNAALVITEDHCKAKLAQSAGNILLMTGTAATQSQLSNFEAITNTVTTASDVNDIFGIEEPQYNPKERRP